MILSVSVILYSNKYKPKPKPTKWANSTNSWVKECKYKRINTKQLHLNIQITLLTNASLGVKIRWKNQESIYNPSQNNVSYGGQRIEVEHRVLKIFLGCCHCSILGDIYTGDHFVINHYVYFLFWHLRTSVLYFILKLLTSLIDRVAPYWKPSNNLPLSVSYSHLEIAYFSPAHFIVGTQSFLLLLKKTKKILPTLESVFELPSRNKLLLRCHKNLSLFFSLKILVVFSEMHSLTTYSKPKATHQLLFITLFISFILGRSLWWTEFVNVYIYLLPNVKSSL